MHGFGCREMKAKDDYLHTDTVELGINSIRGSILTATAQGIIFCLNLGRVAILARLLTPDDFGLVGMVTVVTGFVVLFKDAGLSLATVQRKEITHEQISNLFWANVALSLVCMMVVAASAPLVTWFYGRQELLGITIVLAGAFVLSGVVVQHQALLQRRMQFGRLVLIRVVGQAMAALSAIAMAWFGFRYWALVGSQYVSGLCCIVGCFVACPWRPSWLYRNSGVRGMLAFGKNLTGFNVVNYFARNGDNLLIGKFCGGVELGLYSRAYSLLMLPLSQVNAPISAVAIPALSRLQDDSSRYRHYYFSAIHLICAISMPLVALLVALSDNVILIVLGPQWTEATTVFLWLAIAGLVQSIYNTSGWLFVSQNRTAEMFRWGVVNSCVLVFCFVVGLQWGIRGVAACYAIGCVCFSVPSVFWVIGRAGPIRARDFYRQMAVPVGGSLCLLVVLLGLHKAQWIRNIYLETAIAALVTACVVVTLLLHNQSGRQLLQRIITIGVPAKWRSCLKRTS